MRRSNNSKPKAPPPILYVQSRRGTRTPLYCNPQGAAMTIAPGTAPLTTQSITAAVVNSMESDVKDLMKRETTCHISIVIHTTDLLDASVSAIRNPVSTCSVSSLVVIDAKDTPEKTEKARQWLYQHGLEQDTPVYYGETGFRSMLQDDSIYAVYLYVPSSQQHHYVMTSLQAKKHVLLNDPESTPYHEFMQQAECSTNVNKFLQFSAMFAHHDRSKNFWDCVCATKTFGSIQNVEAILFCNIHDLAAVDIPYPLLPHHGCIRRLTRFCILLTTLMLVDAEPLAATVVESTRDTATGEPVAATCVVEFSTAVTLRCRVAYTQGATRQVLTVQSDANKFATMTDFVIPHPDGLANYRVYDKRFDQGREQIIKGACLDVPRALPHHVTQWREFHRLSRTVDATTTQNPEVQRFTNASVATKHVLMALDESYQRGGGETIKIEKKKSAGEANTR